jgi:hypothetical protein
VRYCPIKAQERLALQKPRLSTIKNTSQAPSGDALRHAKWFRASISGRFPPIANSDPFCAPTRGSV